SLRAANAQIGVARAALFPSITLTGAAGVQTAQFGDLLAGPGAAIWSIGAGLAAPIFDAGRRGARVDQAQARREQSVAGYQRAIETGFREVSDALVNVQQTGESEAELMLRLQAARNALDLSTLRYQSGYSPYLEVLDAQRTANDAELAFVRNRQSRLSFSVDPVKALGGFHRVGELGRLDAALPEQPVERALRFDQLGAERAGLGLVRIHQSLRRGTLLRSELEWLGELEHVHRPGITIELGAPRVAHAR